MRRVGNFVHSQSIIAAALVALGALGLSSPAGAYQDAGEERVDYTAYTLRPGEIAAGPFKAEIGLPGGAMIGTYIPTWVASPFVKGLIPTAFVKIRDPFAGPVAVSLRVGMTYFDGTSLAATATRNKEAKASLVVIPLEAAISARFSEVFSQSVFFTYVALAAGGTDVTSQADIQGAAAFTNSSVSTLLEFRLNRITAITLLGRVLVHQGHARFQGNFTEGSTTVDADIGTRPRVQSFAACIVPGLAFSWANVNLNLGLGYGTWWIPIVDLPLGGQSVVPDANFFFRF